MFETAVNTALVQIIFYMFETAVNTALIQIVFYVWNSGQHRFNPNYF